MINSIFHQIEKKHFGLEVQIYHLKFQLSYFQYQNKHDDSWRENFSISFGKMRETQKEEQT